MPTADQQFIKVADYLKSIIAYAYIFLQSRINEKNSKYVYFPTFPDNQVSATVFSI